MPLQQSNYAASHDLEMEEKLFGFYCHYLSFDLKFLENSLAPNKRRFLKRKEGKAARAKR
jgi:hypothetical protein